MNTIARVPVQADTPVIPADHPSAARPTLVPGDTPLADPLRAIRPTTAQQWLTAARDVMDERAREYDKPEGERSVGAVVVAFNAITGRQLTEAEGWLFMRLVKDVRLFSATSFHSDSGRDGVAYAALMVEAKGRE